jgi:hypothetical protein
MCTAHHVWLSRPWLGPGSLSQPSSDLYPLTLGKGPVTIMGVLRG